jgi:hypothetical protein
VKARFLAVLVATGCLAAAAAQAQSQPDAGPGSATAPTDAGSAPTNSPSGAPLSWNVALADGGPVELDGGVPTDADLEVRFEPRLPDLRVRLLDATGHQVPATERVRLSTGTSVLIHPDPALQPGSRYSLVAEPEVSESLRDAEGHPFVAAELGLRTAGEPPPKKPAKRRRHHR